MVSPEFLRDDTSLIESLEDKVHEIVAAMELPRESRRLHLQSFSLSTPKPAPWSSLLPLGVMGNSL